MPQSVTHGICCCGTVKVEIKLAVKPFHEQLKVTFLEI
jgi:hypothetical protein